METNQKDSQYGFTLLELMITVAVLGVILALAVPSYLDYTRKTRFSEIVKATAPYKSSVSECIQNIGFTNLSDCDAGTNGIPTAITSPAGHVASLIVVDGVITATATATDGLNSETYILIPNLTSGLITWVPSGTGVTTGLAGS